MNSYLTSRPAAPPGDNILGSKLMSVKAPRGSQARLRKDRWDFVSDKTPTREGSGTTTSTGEQATMSERTEAAERCDPW